MDSESLFAPHCSPKQCFCWSSLPICLFTSSPCCVRCVQLNIYNSTITQLGCSGSPPCSGSGRDGRHYGPGASRPPAVAVGVETVDGASGSVARWSIMLFRARLRKGPLLWARAAALVDGCRRLVALGPELFGMNSTSQVAGGRSVDPGTTTAMNRNL